MQSSPFATPEAELDSTPGSESQSPDERVRRAHLSHEQHIRGLGMFWFVCGALFLLFGLLVFAMSGVVSSGRPTIEGLVVSTVSLLFGGGHLFLGRWLYRLEPRARIPSVVVACLGLFNVPIGTAINFFFMSLLVSDQGRKILSAPYRGIMARTWQIERRSSRLMWTLTIALLVLFFAGAGLIFIGMTTYSSY